MGHGVQMEEPVVEEYVPAKQSWQVLMDVAPVALEYFPVAHKVHKLAPALEYDPAAHVKHVASEVWPVDEEYFPAGQLVHTLTPVVDEE